MQILHPIYICHQKNRASAISAIPILTISFSFKLISADFLHLLLLQYDLFFYSLISFNIGLRLFLYSKYSSFHILLIFTFITTLEPLSDKGINKIDSYLDQALYLLPLPEELGRYSSCILSSIVY